jgi:hypothetical protein
LFFSIVVFKNFHLIDFFIMIGTSLFFIFLTSGTSYLLLNRRYKNANKIVMKVGDTVKMSDKNLNHLKNDVCAYANMEGVVQEIYEDNSFVLKCETSTLVVPMRNAFKQRIKGVWIWLNGTLVFHESKKVKR